MRLAVQGLALVGFLVITEVSFAGGLRYLLSESHTELLHEERARLVVARTEKLEQACLKSDKLVTRYVAHRDPRLKAEYLKQVDEFRQVISELQSDLKDDPVATELLRSIAQRVERLISKAAIALEQTERATSISELVDAANNIRRETRADSSKLIIEVSHLLDSQQQVLDESSNSQQHFRARINQFLFLGLAVNIAVALLFGLFLLRKVSYRLNIVIDNAKRFTEERSINEPIRGNDEIAALDRQFHDMALEVDYAIKKERAIFDSTLDVICSINKHGTFTTISPASQSVWGYAPEELLGRSFQAVIAESNSTAFDTVLENIVRSGDKETIEFTVKHKEGFTLSMDWTINWSNEEQSLFCVAHDVSLRKQNEQLMKESEERMKALIRAMPVGVLIANEAGIIEVVNDRLCQMLDYPESELMTLPIGKLFPLANYAVKSSESNKSFEMLVATKNSEMAVLFSCSHLQLAQTAKVLAVALDITERYEMQKLKQAFVAMVSDQLRTPLSAIIKSLEQMTSGAMGEISPVGKSNTERAQNSAYTLMRIVTDLLDLEKVDSSALGVTATECDADLLLTNTVNMIENFAADKEISISVRPSRLRVMADSDRIVQVLVNLVSNAIKFSPEKGTVSLSCLESAEFVKFNIQDRGRGIPDSHKEAIFEKFQQVKMSDGSRGRGTGLGLTICKLIVESHGGQIGVDSVEGEGSCFWFTLPMVSIAKPFESKQ